MMKFGKLLATGSVLLTVVLGTSACTPDMPPELLAQLADSSINCGTADVTAYAPGAITNVINQWGSDYSALCAGATVTVSDQPGPANIEYTDGSTPPADCPTFLTIPVAVDGAAIASTVAGVDGIIVDPATLSKIINGEITSWADPAIAALNSGLALPDEPVVLSTTVAKPVAEALDSWLKRVDPKNWKGFPSSFTITESFDATNVGPEITSEGGLGFVPFSYVTTNGLQSLAIKSAKDQDAVPTNLESIYSALTQLTASGSASPLVPVLDPGMAPIPPDGSNTAPAPWQAIFPIYEHLCSGGNENDIRSFARYSMRTDAQGFLATFNLQGLPLSVRGTALEMVSKGLPSPSLIGDPSASPTP